MTIIDRSQTKRNETKRNDTTRKTKYKDEKRKKKHEKKQFLLVTWDPSEQANCSSWQQYNTIQKSDKIEK